MPPADQLKRRLLRAAVRDNVDTIRGVPPRPLRVSTQIRRGAMQATLLVALPTLGLLAYNPLSGTDRAAVLATAPAILTFRAPTAIAPVTASLGAPLSSRPPANSTPYGNTPTPSSARAGASESGAAHTLSGGAI